MFPDKNQADAATVTGYDPVGRPITVTTLSKGATFASRLLSYAAGDAVTVIPPAGPVVTTTSDVLGRTVEQKWSAKGVADRVAKYGYDVSGNLTEYSFAALWRAQVDGRTL